MKRGILLGLLLVVLLAVPVAAATYTAAITVTEDGTTGYDMLPVSVTVDNDGLADLNIMLSTGLDTRVLQGSTELPHMVVDDRLLFAMPIIQGNQYPLEYTFGNTALPSFPVLVGDGGYVTTSDAAALELGNDFEIEFDGWVDTSITTQPTVDDSNTSVENSGVTSHDVSLPSNMLAGDLLIILFGIRDGSAGIATPSGWTELYNVEYGGITVVSMAVFYKVASGGEGATETITTTESALSAHQSFCISGYYGSPEVSSGDHSSGHPNSDSLSPSWITAGETLWLSLFTGRDTVANSVSSYPTNYGDGQYVVTSNTYTMAGSATRLLEASAENPGAYAMDNNLDGWGAVTIGVRGTYPLVEKEGAFSVYIDDGDIGAKLIGGSTLTISATQSSDEYKVNVWADTTNFGIDIDDLTEDSTALGGVSAADNANDWTIFIPYFDYYEHTVSDTLIVDYEPVTMVVGTTLPDKEGTAQNGVITFGSNPSNIATVLGALLPVATSAASATAEDTQASFVPDTGDTTWTAPGIEGENLPLYGFFKSLFTTYRDQGGADIPMPLFWKVVVMMAAWAFGTVVLITTRQVAFAFIAYVAGFAVPAYYMGGLLDSWIPIVYGIGAACLAALTWKWTSNAIA